MQREERKNGGDGVKDDVMILHYQCIQELGFIFAEHKQKRGRNLNHRTFAAFTQLSDSAHTLGNEVGRIPRVNITSAVKQFALGEEFGDSRNNKTF